MNIREAYERHKNLKLAAAELGMPWQSLYVHLRKAGVPVTGDKARYGSDKDRLAAASEMEFEKLVPFAKNQNKDRFQAKCDFLVGKEKVDVKCARLRQGCKRFKARRWSFSIKKQELLADFMVCFAMLDSGSYRLLLVPGELIRNYQTISIPENGKSKWLQYEVTASELTEFFLAITEQKP